MTVSYLEDPMPRGAAGSARDAALATASDTFVVADATSIPNVDLQDLLHRHQSSDACLTVVVHTEARRNGSPALRVPTGIYVFSRRALDSVPAHGFCDIKERLIPQLHQAGECVVAYEAAEPTPRVLDASTYMAVNEWMVAQLVRDGAEYDGYVKSGDALVHREAFVATDAAFVGPVLVGPGARVQPRAVIVGPTSIGREATIEEGVLISRSAVWRRSCVGEQASVESCIVADDAFVAAGSQAFADVVTAERRSNSERDWVVSERVYTAKVPSLDVTARLARLVFGASWSRSPAAQ
jgi:NDP-sugar pyrophosphorylase family protein